MALDALFKASVLTEAINQLYPVKTPILDKIFGAKRMMTSGVFQWDIVSGSQRILSNLKIHEPASVSKGTKLTTVTCTGTRFAKKRLIAAADLDKLRNFGSQFVNDLVGTRIGHEQVDMKGEIDRTREFMAGRALTGQVVSVDDNGVETVLVDYNFSAAQKPVLAGKKKWTDSESDPIENIRAWKKIIIRATGGTVDSFYAFCGSDAMTGLLKNQSVRDLVKNTIGDQIAKTGRVTYLAEADIEEYLGCYLDKNGAVQEIIPANAFILVGVSAQNAAEIFVPTIEFADPNGVGTGNPASMFFSKAWEDDDPSGKWIKVESRPLPVLYKPEAIVIATVV